MKEKFFSILVIFFFIAGSIYAQEFDSPVAYMTAISNAQDEMNKTYMAYMSAAAHNGQAKRVEKMRQQTLESIINCKYKISDLPFYKGDNSLRKSSMSYVDLCYKIFNEDYAHIVNMEEIAEQSYDEMQAYLLLQEKTSEKVKQASDDMDTAESIFAAKYNITLVNTKSELGVKMEKAGQLNHYHNDVYLLFFKCYWEDQQMMAAVDKKNLNNIEQSRNALISYAQEGLAALDTIKPFDGDRALTNACSQALKTYKSIAENDIPKLTDFFLKQEAFEKMKKTFELKPAESRTKDEVTAYNKAVNDLNTGVNMYNQTNQKSNNSRNQAIHNWNETESTFLDAHMPYYNK